MEWFENKNLFHSLFFWQDPPQENIEDRNEDPWEGVKYIVDTETGKSPINSIILSSCLNFFLLESI